MLLYVHCLCLVEFVVTLYHAGEKLLEVQLFLLKRLNCSIKLDEWPLPSLSFFDWDILLALPRAWLATLKRKDKTWESWAVISGLTKESLSRKRLRGGAVDWRTALEAGRSQVRFPIRWQSLRPRFGRGVDSASNRNECQGFLLGVKSAGAWVRQPYHLLYRNSGNLSLLDTSGPVQACTRRERAASIFGVYKSKQGSLLLFDTPQHPRSLVRSYCSVFSNSNVLFNTFFFLYRVSLWCWLKYSCPHAEAYIISSGLRVTDF